MGRTGGGANSGCFKATVKRVVKYTMLGLLVLIVIPAAQSMVFSRNAANGTIGPQADLIAIFPGEPERIAAGVRLAAEGRAAKMLVACREPTANLVRPYLKQFPDFPNGVGFVTAGLSRGTFDDALVTRHRIREFGFRRVILVTSDYHILRSSVLLKLLLAGSGVEVQQFAVAGGKPGEYWLVLREMVKLWTSLGELGYYSVTGKLLGDWPLVQRARAWKIRPT